MTTVRIRAIAAGGDGVATLDNGKTVFVPRTAPGDVAAIEVVDERPRWARGRVLGIEEPSPDRVQPTCPHYEADACGGCQLQHLSLSAQHAAKRRIVGDALRRIGGYPEHEDPPIVEAPGAWRYRSRVTLAAQGRAIGFHRFDAPGEVFDLSDCRLASPGVMDLWAAVSAHRDLLPDALEGLTLREDPAGGRHVVVEAPAADRWDATPLAGAVGGADIAFWSRAAAGELAVAGGAPSTFPVGAFDQVQRAFGERIRHDALRGLGDVSGRVIWDLYAGFGDATAHLVEAGATVHAVESEGAAVEAGTARTAALVPGSATWHHGRVERVLPSLPRPDAVFMNPPRAGLAEAVAGPLGRWGRETPGARAAYVSCDPATMARDLRRMRPLAPTAVTAYDLFPQTAHVETVAVLEAA